MFVPIEMKMWDFINYELKVEFSFNNICCSFVFPKATGQLNAQFTKVFHKLSRFF